ncbi:hypothetical protein BLNAU_13743 [Blattamonas nauphoetae]|uniref:Uncharacterized protein n=1 Tax=Blattamonas nauphoetae TaxID=2049346 RepID=A0ABQ9XI29_9EUKA|nr:hypothetical protein BLNAU_13743 [Blattamonas nauphoetae]
MEDIEDVIEEKLRNDKKGYFEKSIATFSIEWKTSINERHTLLLLPHRSRTAPLWKTMRRHVVTIARNSRDIPVHLEDHPELSPARSYTCTEMPQHPTPRYACRFLVFYPIQTHLPLSLRILDLSRTPNSFLFSTDCSAFLNWDEGRHQTEHEQAVVFQSLVATVKLKPALDVSLEAKVVQFLESVSTGARSSYTNRSSHSIEIMAVIVIWCGPSLFSDGSDCVQPSTTQLTRLDNSLTVRTARLKIVTCMTYLVPEIGKCITLRPLLVEDITAGGIEAALRGCVLHEVVGRTAFRFRVEGHQARDHPTLLY